MPEKFITVDHHHEVLAAWCEIRSSAMIPLPVWCLDFHTDTMPCFRGGSPPPPENTWQDGTAVLDAISRLRHDEHFDWAIRAGIISEAHIGTVSPSDTVIAHPGIHVYNPPDFPDAGTILNHPEACREKISRMLESGFLKELFPELPAPGCAYILDIDCDYIMCAETLAPQNGEVLAALIRNAAVVTLSRENDWVRLLKLPGEKISGDSIATALKQFPY